MKLLKTAVFWAVLITAVTFSFTKPAMADRATTIAVSPTITELSQEDVGGTLKVNITVSDVTSLWDWKVRLNWNPQVLNLTNIEEGPFLKSGGPTLFLWPEGAPEINQGDLPEIYCALFVARGVNGSGVLATVAFKALSAGASAIAISETQLDTYDAPIAHTSLSGYVIIPWTFLALGQEIHVRSNSTVTNFQFNGTSKKISFEVNGPDGTTGFANVTFPKVLLSGELTVYIDQFPLTNGVNYRLNSNSTHYRLNLTYSHSAHKIEIVGTVGTQATPEFPLMIVLILFIVGVGAVGVVFIVFKKRVNRYRNLEQSSLFHYFK